MSDVAEKLAAERLESARRLDASLNTLREACMDRETLRREIDDLRRTAASLEAECDQLRDRGHELTAERDRWRDLATRFRSGIGIGDRTVWFTSESADLHRTCRDFDAMTAPVPESGALVPWTAETAPNCPAVFRRINRTDYRYRACAAEYWMLDGVHVSSEGKCGFEHLLKSWEWSRDGVTWQPCGVRKGVE